MPRKGHVPTREVLPDPIYNDVRVTKLVNNIMLDGKNHLLKERILTRGTANATLITPREIYVEALRNHAVHIILIHNHPSGDPSPSRCDIEVTERILEAGEMLGIHLLDHIIIGDQRYVSFREQGLIDDILSNS